MLQLLTLKNYRTENISTVVQQLRQTFADVFSESYSRQLHEKLKPALDNNEYKSADELKESKDTTLHGFSDLLSKKAFFSKPLSFYKSKKALKSVFKTIYQGVGFDDEAAFLLAFHDFDHNACSAEEHFSAVAKNNRLSKEDCTEVVDYLEILKQINRKLLEVGFVAIVDENQAMMGFAIYHLLKSENDIILHVRQAAMRQQGLGYASVMASYFADHFPKAIYEANQRRANKVMMKQNLVAEEILNVTPAVLGYNNMYYLGLRSKTSVLSSFLSHQTGKPQKVQYPLYGIYHHDDCEIQPYFNQSRLIHDSLHDDNVDEFHYLKRKPIIQIK